MHTLNYIEIHVPEGEHKDLFGETTYQDIVHLLLRQHAAGVTVFRGREGIDANGRLQHVFSDYSDSLPIILEIVTPPSEKLVGMIRDSLEGHPHCATITPALNAKEWASPNWEANSMIESAILKIYMKEEDRYQGIPLYHALVLAGRQAKFHWVNVQRALEGFGPERIIRREKLFHLSAHAPVVVEVTGSMERIVEFAKLHEELLGEASGPAIILPGQLLSASVSP